jgi:hypothetical protein
MKSKGVTAKERKILSSKHEMPNNNQAQRDNAPK